MKKPTIYEIKREVEARGSFYFSKDTMRFFRQTLRDFKVYKTTDPNIFNIQADSKMDNTTHKTNHFYNAVTKKISSEFKTTTE